MKKKRCSFNPNKLEDFQSGGWDRFFYSRNKPFLWLLPIFKVKQLLK